jgi:hypothetical protein
MAKDKKETKAEPKPEPVAQPEPEPKAAEPEPEALAALVLGDRHDTLPKDDNTGDDLVLHDSGQLGRWIEGNFVPIR